MGTVRAGDGRPIDHVVVMVADLDRAAAAYRGLGFTLTPRAQHPFGTANHLAQLPGGNFIELLAIDRPELLRDPAPDTDPPRFSFASFNRDFLAAGDGMSMLVLQGDDSRGDVARFKAAGLDTYAPLDFERDAGQPDGSVAKVAFSLAFATDRAMPRAAFFTCHGHFPENFWQPEYQCQANGAAEIVEAVMVADRPADCGAFLSGFSGGRASAIDGGIAVACGRHRVSVLAPAAVAARFPGATVTTAAGPRFAAIAIAGPTLTPGVTAAEAACGLAIEWRRTSDG